MHLFGKFMAYIYIYTFFNFSQLFEAISVAVIRRGWGIVYRNKLKMAVFGQRKVQIPSSTCPMKTINCGVDLNGTPITTTPSSPQKLGQPYAVVP